MQTSKVYNSDTQLQSSHFIRRKGDNPSDMVFRQGKWVNIAEHNAGLNINKR